MEIRLNQLLNKFMKKIKVSSMQGVLLLNKSKNKTSRDMVNELSHIFGLKKIGHTGTLDPIATGVLVICIDRYTKLVERLESLEKEYIAEIKLGIKTDTLDITGQILDNRECQVDKDNLIKVLNSLVGKYKQVIPKYSAKKINGKKLYEYARENIDISLPENEVEIKAIELISFNNDIITFKTTVTKGTYIRSLIQTICDQLGVIGTMNNLIRVRQGKFDLNDCYTIDEVKNGNYQILKCPELFNIESYNLTQGEYNKVKNGNVMNFESIADNLLLMYEVKEIAIYKKVDTNYVIDVMLDITNK